MQLIPVKKTSKTGFIYSDGFSANMEILAAGVPLAKLKDVAALMKNLEKKSEVVSDNTLVPSKCLIKKASAQMMPILSQFVTCKADPKKSVLVLLPTNKKGVVQDSWDGKTESEMLEFVKSELTEPKLIHIDGNVNNNAQSNLKWVSSTEFYSSGGFFDSHGFEEVCSSYE